MKTRGQPGTCDEAAKLQTSLMTEEDESSDTLAAGSGGLKGLSILQSAQYKHQDRVTFQCWILLWTGIYDKHLMSAHHFLMGRGVLFTLK